MARRMHGLDRRDRRLHAQGHHRLVALFRGPARHLGRAVLLRARWWCGRFSSISSTSRWSRPCSRRNTPSGCACLRDPPRHSLAAIIGMITETFPDTPKPVLAARSRSRKHDDVSRGTAGWAWLAAHAAPGGPVAAGGNSGAMPALWRARLPAHGHVINLCTDRYRFMTGFAAALQRRPGQPAAVRQRAGRHRRTGRGLPGSLRADRRRPPGAALHGLSG